jgi:Tol biopolymer transport system component
MVEMPPPRADRPVATRVARRLDTWKEIAAYLGRDVTTVRRWEKREGLPVHRHLHDKLGSVYGYTNEIDEWSARRRQVLPPDTNPVNRTAQGSASWKIAAAVVLVLLAGTAAIWNLRSRAPRPASVPIALSPPAGTAVNTLAIAPDGERVAFTAAAPNEEPHLWIRRLDTPDMRPLAGTEGAAFPFWSPDGKSVGFFSNRRLKKVIVATGAVEDLASAPDGRGGTWNERGVIIFAPDREGPLLRVQATGRETSPVTTCVPAIVGGHAWPEFLPDGRHFIYTDTRTDPRLYGIYVGDLESGATRRLLTVFSSGTITPDGYLLYSSQGLKARQLDLRTLELVGPEARVLDRVNAQYGIGHKVDVSVARSGLLAIRQATTDRTRLVLKDRQGRELTSFTGAPAYSNPALSPEGTHAWVTTFDPDGDWAISNLWQVDLATGQHSRRTYGRTLDIAPVWSRDSSRVLFASNRRRHLELYEMSASGTGEGDLVPVPDATMIVPENWASDGHYATYSAVDARTKFDIWLLPLTGDRKPVPLVRTKYNEAQSRVSYDGKLVAYTSDESGRFEVWVQTFPTPSSRWQVSTSGGADPHWRADGRELFYVSADRKMMAVPVTPGASPRFGVPTALFAAEIPYIWVEDARNH